MSLLTETELRVGDAQLPIGAYSLYLLPGEPKWQLIVNKSVGASAYEQKADIVRISMDSGKLSQPVEQLSLALGHVAPKQCNLRIYFAKKGMWAEIHEQ